jgi:hypothetical protein
LSYLIFLRGLEARRRETKRRDGTSRGGKYIAGSARISASISRYRAICGSYGSQKGYRAVDKDKSVSINLGRQFKIRAFVAQQGAIRYPRRKSFRINRA